MFDKFLPGFLENIFVNAPIGIFTTDLDRNITTANQLAARLHGLENGNELLGKTFPNFTCQSTAIIKSLMQVLSGEINKADIEYQLNVGSETKTIWLVSSLLRDGEYIPIGLLNMCEDITAEKKLAEQVQNYTQKLENMVEEKTQELAVANRQLIRSERVRVLGNLLTSVAHEIGNPLCSLECLLTDVEDSTTDRETKKSVSLCLGEVDRMGRLLKGLRGSYHSTNGKKTEVDINQLLENVLHVNQFRLSNKNIQVEKHIDPKLPSLFFSADQIKQVFMNIIINAGDSMPDGGQLTICTRFENQSILIEFSDTGIGIPSGNLDKIFTPFFTTKESSNGLGLGLSVSNQILEANGGKLWVKSKPGKGTSFFVTLPVNDAK